jgi:hypothetical protein
MGNISAPLAKVAFCFRLLPHCRELVANGEPIRLGWRAFDVLLVLMWRMARRGCEIGECLSLVTEHRSSLLLLA